MRFEVAGLIHRDADCAGSSGQGKSVERLCGLLLRGGQIGENAHDVALLHDQQLLAVKLDLGARPFAKQHAVANLEIDRNELAGFVAATGANGGDFALRGFFLGTVRNDDPASGLQNR